MPRTSLRRWVKTSATVSLTVLGVALAAYVLARAHLALTITVAALLVAVALDRAVQALQRWRVPRGLGIALVVLAVVAAVVGVVVLLVPPAVGQVEQLVKRAPELLDRLRATEVYRRVDHLVAIDRLVSREQQRAPEIARALVEPALTAATAVARGVAALVTVLFVVIFMLASGRQLVWSAVAAARPERRARYAAVLGQIYHSLGGYIAGLLLLVLCNAVFSGVFLAILGVPYFLPLAVLSGLSSLVPYAGALLAGVLMTGVAWVDHGPWIAAVTAGYYVAYQQFENHVIAPLVYRRTVDLNPLVILVAALFLTDLAGVAGALVAVPLAASAQIVLREVLRARRERLHLPRVRGGPEVMRSEPEAEAPH